MRFRVSPFRYYIVPDVESGKLVVDADKPSTYGPNYIYASLSFYIFDDAFIGIGGIENATQSKKLKMSLISIGYISLDGYLTTFYSPSSSLILEEAY